jgi:hypothetical protein
MCKIKMLKYSCGYKWYGFEQCRKIDCYISFASKPVRAPCGNFYERCLVCAEEKEEAVSYAEKIEIEEEALVPKQTCRVF